MADDPVADEAYLLDQWSVADGLPVVGLTGIHLARSGYLWATSFGGLVRFDGHGFEIFDNSGNPDLPSNALFNLKETPDGSLWMTTAPLPSTVPATLVRFDGRQFWVMGREQGLPDEWVRTQRMDDEGRLWVGTSAGLVRWSDGRFHAWMPELVSDAVLAILPMPDGRVWVGTANQGLYEFKNEHLRRHYTRADGLPSDTIRFLDVDADGTLWAGTDTGAALLRDHEFEAVSGLDGQPVVNFATSPTGDVYITTASHGFRWRGGRLERRSDRPTEVGPADIVGTDPGGSIWTIDQNALARDGRQVLEAPCTIAGFAFDAAGAVWLATSCDGLWRLRQRDVVAISPQHGLPESNVYGMAVTPDGTLWATVGANAVGEIRDGRVTAAHQTGRPGYGGLRALLAQPDNTLLVNRAPGLCLLSEGVCEPLPGLPELLTNSAIRALHVDRQGRLWAGGDNGTWYQDSEGWQAANELLQLPEWAIARTIHEAASGNLWFGTDNDGLRRLSRTGTVNRVSLEHGLSSNAVRDIFEDGDGRLWVVTEYRGLCRSLAPEHAPEIRFKCLGKEQGIPSTSLHRIIPDDFGRMWFNSNDGIFVIERKQLQSVLDGQASRVYARVFNERDGLPHREGNGGVQNAGVRLHDGRLAFPGQGGIAIVDPARIRTEPRRPRAVVETLTLPGGRELQVESHIDFPLGERVFSVRFAALSPGLTDQFFFRYRLGTDTHAEWNELGTKRSLSFESLPPGRYRFELVAVDAASGEAGPVTTIELHLPARLYETGLFRSGLLACFAFLALFALWWQRRRAGIMQRQLELAVKHRTQELMEQQEATQTALATVEQQRSEIKSLAEVRTQFFANVSHELRNPLTLLIGPLEDSERGQALSGEQAAVMLRNARRLSRLVEQLLDLERIEAGGLPLRREAVDLVRLAEENAATFIRHAEREGIALETTVPTTPVRAYVDAEQISRVVGNLLSNAVKFTPRGGHVRLELNTVNGTGGAGRAKLMVTDTGPGITPGWREKIFDRFSQMGSAAVREREGAGLGLALSREVVDLHGGSLHVEPAGSGGSRFVLELPLAGYLQGAGQPITDETSQGKAAAQEVESLQALHTTRSPDSAPVTSNMATGERRRVLIAEDYAELRAYIASVLADEYDVETVEDGEAALVAARRDPPDIVVSDIKMPRRNGLELARALRTDPEFAGIPLIFLTARGSDQDQIAGLAIGADQYLKKPFHGDVLRAHVAAALRSCERLRHHFAHHPPKPESEEQTPEVQSRRLTGKVTAWVESRIHEEDLSIDELASELHMSRRSLERKLQAETGQTPAEYIRGVRLRQARKLLKQSAGNVSEIAYAVGFKSLAIFSRAYRATYGQPPSAHLSNQ